MTGIERVPLRSYLPVPSLLLGSTTPFTLPSFSTVLLSSPLKQNWLEFLFNLCF